VLLVGWGNGSAGRQLKVDLPSADIAGMGWKTNALDVARRTGALGAVGVWYGRQRLTVLAYHRIADAAAPGLVGYRGNVSASPESFADQLDWMAGHFDVVGMDDVLEWLDGEAELPARPALITFDDGYQDNLEIAAPLLAARGMPATLFLTTGPTDGGPALYWDHVAWMFGHSERTAADLPGLGHREWSTEADRQHTIRDLIYATKWLPPEGRARILDDLEVALGIKAPDRIPGLYLDWEGVRLLSGWTVGAHTVHHPILTSIARQDAVGEIADSAGRIAEEVGRPVRSLAYPNGLKGDYDHEIADGARAAGIEVAFTLRPGPARLSEVAANPLSVRRIYVGFSDGPGKFSGNAMGVGRLSGAGR